MEVTGRIRRDSTDVRSLVLPGASTPNGIDAAALTTADLSAVHA